MTKDRPDIPEPMKREIRQRCGFGCVICGLPLCEYEHMEEWAKVRKHVVSEITLLCDSHHREKTNGLLPVAAVREANCNPFNKQTGVSPPYNLHYTGNSCQLVVGGVEITRIGLSEGISLVAVAIDREPLMSFTFEQGHLFLTLQVFDDQNHRVLWVERNELRFCPSTWDIRLEGRTLSIRESQGQFLFQVVFSPPNRVEVRRGRFALNGLELLIYPNHICYANGPFIMSELALHNLDVAIMVGETLGSRAAICLPAVRRGEPDRGASQRWMREVALREAVDCNLPTSPTS